MGDDDDALPAGTATDGARTLSPAGRAPDALEAERERVDRFVVRPESERFRVIDIWTGETVIIAMTAQHDMSEEDAIHTARLLNRRTEGGDCAAPP